MQDASQATPTHYGMILHIMREYKWSWNDIVTAPADLIQEVAIRLEAEYHWRDERRKLDEDLAQQRRR